MNTASVPWEGAHGTPKSESASRQLWRITKSIDELGGEWTYTIFIARALNHFYRHPPHHYYPLSNFERMGLELILIDRAREFELTPDEIGGVTLSFTVYPSFYDAVAGRVELPRENELPIGQHAVSALGLETEDSFAFQHGWPEWAPNGLGFMSRAYFDRFATEAWLIRRRNRGPSSFDSAGILLDQSVTSSVFREEWRRFGPSGSEATLRHPGLIFRWYSFYDLDDENEGEVLILEDANRTRIASAVVTYRISSNTGQTTSALIDLFVPPQFRRNGYARLLENWMAERSISRNAVRIEAAIWDADAVVGRARAEGFLNACGYTLEALHGSQQVARGVRMFG